MRPPLIAGSSLDGLRKRHPRMGDFHLSWRELGIMALPVTAALGPYLLPVPMMGVTVFAYRALVVVLFAASLLLFSRLSWWEIPAARTYGLLGAVWIFWATVNAFRAPALEPAVLEVAALVFGFVTGITILQLRGYTAPALTALRRGWVLAFLATAVVAMWELTTGQHLPSFKVEHAPPGALQGIAISTFGNPNNYAAFLLLAAPFLLWSHTSTRSTRRRFFYTACLVLLPFLLFLTASRVALLGLLAEVVVLWLIHPRYRFRIVLYLGVLGGLGLVVLQVLSLEPRMLDELSTLLGGRGVGGNGSIAKRWNLLLSGLWLLIGSMGLGVGPGGFEVLLRRGAVPFDTGGLVDPHNFWIEVLSQYGVLVFCSFALWLMYVTYVVTRKRLRSSADPGELRTRQVAEAVLVGLVGYIFAAFANSAYMTQSINWMFWASIVVMASYLWRKRIVAVVPLTAVVRREGLDGLDFEWLGDQRSEGEGG